MRKIFLIITILMLASLVLIGAACKKEESKEEAKEEEIIDQRFASPEATFETFLTAIETVNEDLYMECLSKRMLKEAEENPKITISKVGEVSKTVDTTLIRQASYEVIEKTDKYAIMGTQTLMPYGKEMKKGPNFYFENEDGLWKMDYIAFLSDILCRAFFPEDIQKVIDNWKKSMELPSGYIE